MQNQRRDGLHASLCMRLPCCPPPAPAMRCRVNTVGLASVSFCMQRTTGLGLASESGLLQSARARRRGLLPAAPVLPRKQ